MEEFSYNTVSNVDLKSTKIEDDSKIQTKITVSTPQNETGTIAHGKLSFKEQLFVDQKSKTVENPVPKLPREETPFKLAEPENGLLISKGGLKLPSKLFSS
jgi:hypothetical protein